MRLFHGIKTPNPGLLFYLLLLLWFGLNLLQAAFSDALADEAYYYFYASGLSWGYFDHPPMIAIMIWASAQLFDGELGIRFMTVLLQPFTLLVIWKILDIKQPTTADVLSFFGITASIVLFAAYGFVATPDGPLLFFTALLLLAYKNILSKDKLLDWALLSIAMAGLIYSKYQGGLVILLFLLSKPGLLLNLRMWIAGLVSLIMLSPHISWQIVNEMPSFAYHTTGRARPFNVVDFLVFLPNQMAAFNPFVFPIAVLLMLKPANSNKDAFLKTLRFIAFGLILFFWITTFRGHAEPQWTVAAVIPFIIILHQNRHGRPWIPNYLKRFVYPSILLLVFLRAAIAFEILPIELEFHNQRKWAEQIKEITRGHPVVFRDGYQRPSVYTFYTGIKAHTVNSRFYRRNQYDLNRHEHKFMKRPVAIVSDKYDQYAKAFPVVRDDTVYVRFDENIVPTSQVKIHYELPKNTVFQRGETYELMANFVNPYPFVLLFDNPRFPVDVHIFLVSGGKKQSVKGNFIGASVQLEAFETLSLSFRFTIPEHIASGKYGFAPALRSGPFRDGFNSKMIKVIIE